MYTVKLVAAQQLAEMFLIWCSVVYLFHVRIASLSSHALYIVSVIYLFIFLFECRSNQEETQSSTLWRLFLLSSVLSVATSFWMSFKSCWMFCSVHIIPPPCICKETQTQLSKITLYLNFLNTFQVVKWWSNSVPLSPSLPPLLFHTQHTSTHTHPHTPPY